MMNARCQVFENVLKSRHHLELLSSYMCRAAVLAFYSNMEWSLASKILHLARSSLGFWLCIRLERVIQLSNCTHLGGERHVSAYVTQGLLQLLYYCLLCI